jgi:hypothetical protein
MQARVQRALQQKMYLLGFWTNENHSIWRFKVEGASYSHYYCEISKEKPVHCTCPDHSQRRNFCKHLIFLLLRVARLNFHKAKIGTLSEPILDKTISRAFHTQLTKRFQQQEQENEKSNNNNNNEEMCIICFEGINTTYEHKCHVCRLNTHKCCLKRWAKRNQTCPQCRQKINFVDDPKDCLSKLDKSNIGNEDANKTNSGVNLQ